MKIIIRHFIVCTVLVFWFVDAPAQPRLDSLLRERDSQYIDYNQYKISLQQRPWIKLVELGQKASALIETDNLILNQYLINEINLNQQLNEEIEKLNLEIALLNKEAQMQELLLAEKRNFSHMLMIAAGVTFLLLMAMFILYFDRQKRLRAARAELDRLWAAKNDPRVNPLQNDELSMLADRVNLLTDENEKLKQDLNHEQGRKSEAMESLKKEIRTRRQVEQEIKDLISQIRKK